MSTPSIALIPSGYKSGKLYSQLPVNGDGDLTFARVGDATRVNENGLIEEMATGVPRLDYSDGGCPSLLVEPSSTNLLEYSEDFSNAAWGKIRVSTSNGYTAPDGTQSAYSIIPSTDNNNHFISRAYSPIGEKTLTVFAKDNGYSGLRINTGSSADGFAQFNLTSETVVSSGGTYYENSDIKKISNGWYRCFLSLSSSAQDDFYVYVEDNAGSSFFAGNGTDGLLLWGAQAEEQSYATSYISTSGTTETRDADTVTLDTTGLNLTTITETFSDDTTNIISPVPTTYTVSEGRIKQIIGE